MSNNTERKQTIIQRIRAFTTQPPRKAALSLFAGLGADFDPMTWLAIKDANDA